VKLFSNKYLSTFDLYVADSDEQSNTLNVLTEPMDVTSDAAGPLRSTDNVSSESVICAE
jgi:hypothetical protein